MRQGFRFKNATLLATVTIGALALSAIGCIRRSHAAESMRKEGAAYFKFHIPTYPDTFIFELNDPALIGHARAVLSGAETERIRVGGIIDKTTASYNAQWGFHLKPESIYFFENSAEVCDATIRGIQEQLTHVCGAFLSDCRWCPWGSQLIEEVVF